MSDWSRALIYTDIEDEGFFFFSVHCVVDKQTDSSLHVKVSGVFQLRISNLLLIGQRIFMQLKNSFLCMIMCSR